MKAKLPFAATLQPAIETAGIRPVTPKYHDISAAVYNNVHAALHGEVSSQEALKPADREINRVLRQKYPVHGRGGLNKPLPRHHPDRQQSLSWNASEA